MKIKQSETIKIMRSEINFAPYNPKNHTEDQVAKIIKNFKTVAFLGGIVWNENTGNLIDGHKRIMALDLINKYDETPDTDYKVKVESIFLTPKQEKEQNVFQTKSRTDLDDELMRELMSDDFDYMAAGLSDFDAELYGKLVENNDIAKVVKTRADFYNTDEDKQHDRKMEVRDHQKRIRETKDDEDRGADSYVIIKFAHHSAKKAFMERGGYGPFEKYIDGDEFAQLIEFVD